MVNRENSDGSVDFFVNLSQYATVIFNQDFSVNGGAVLESVVMVTPSLPVLTLKTVLTKSSSFPFTTVIVLRPKIVWRQSVRSFRSVDLRGLERYQMMLSCRLPIIVPIDVPIAEHNNLIKRGSRVQSVVTTIQSLMDNNKDVT